MGKICIDATYATQDELKEILKVAKEVATNLHRTVTVYTSTKTLEVEDEEAEEEKEKDVACYLEEKPESRQQRS